uniref:Uncharacterized protein n=1 Tax=Phyllostachys edulis TaxID=38705 RepID=D3IVT1_PHYED|nr:hypothetical protein [Phyllostachys edulis]
MTWWGPHGTGSRQRKKRRKKKGSRTGGRGVAGVLGVARGGSRQWRKGRRELTAVARRGEGSSLGGGSLAKGLRQRGGRGACGHAAHGHGRQWRCGQQQQPQ